MVEEQIKIDTAKLVAQIEKEKARLVIKRMEVRQSLKRHGGSWTNRN